MKTATETAAISAVGKDSALGGSGPVLIVGYTDTKRHGLRNDGCRIKLGIL